MQKAVEAVLSGEALLAKPLADLFAIKLKKLGATDVADKSDWIETEIRKRLRNEDGLDWTHPFKDESPEAEGNYEVTFDAGDFKTLSEVTESAATSALEKILESLYTLTLETVRQEASSAVTRRKEELAGFCVRLQERWAKSLELYALQLGLAVQYGGDMTQWLRSQATKVDSALIEALVRLHSRGCQVAGEIEVLLQAGFADGALSRWRTLHELTVVAIFLQQHGNETAQRYLDHLAIDSYDLAKKFKTASERLGYADISDKEFSELEAQASKLKMTYGKDFGREYGWASKALAIPDPKFVQIEDSVDFGKLRPFYKIASGTVHAGPKGAFWKLGIIPGSPDMLLAGPSNAGLAEAGRLTAMSLAQLSAPLMMLHTVADSTVWVRVLFELSRDIEREFLAAERKLAREASTIDENAQRSRKEYRKNVRPSEKLSARLERRLGRRH